MNTSKFLGKKISFTIARENLLISEHYFEKLISRKAITVFTNEDSEKYIYMNQITRNYVMMMM